MSDAQAQMAIRYATTQIGKPYDAAGAASAGATSWGRGGLLTLFSGPIIGTALIGLDIKNRINPEGSFFCSELVALAFEHAR